MTVQFSDIANWLGVIGGILSIFLAIIQFRDKWVNRRRVDFSVITANRYILSYNEYDVEQYFASLGHHDPRGPKDRNKLPIKTGDPKLVFTVLEFAFTNNYPGVLTIGRFLIDNWMYSDRYEHGLYDMRTYSDYRVFNLYTKQPIDLSTLEAIPPGGSYALRIEVLEKSNLESYRYRKKVPIGRFCNIKCKIDSKNVRKRLRILNKFDVGVIENSIHRWSDLLGPVHSTSTGTPIPQGVPVTYSDWSNKFHYKWNKTKIGLKEKIKSVWMSF